MKNTQELSYALFVGHILYFPQLLWYKDGTLALIYSKMLSVYVA